MRISDWSSDVCSSDLRRVLQKTVEIVTVAILNHQIVGRDVHANRTVAEIEKVAVAAQHALFGTKSLVTFTAGARKTTCTAEGSSLDQQGACGLGIQSAGEYWSNSIGRPSCREREG